MYKINPLHAIDFYKADHRRQYPEGTEYIYSNFTPRSNKYSNTNLDYIVFFGLQGFIKSFLIDCWNEGFFKKPKKEVVDAYKRRMDTSLGKDAIDVKHIEELHDLGYLPILIKALPEGAKVNYGVPVLTIINTDKRFFWLTNYLESIMSSELWKACTSATTAHQYKLNFLDHSEETGSPKEVIGFQAHDFSFRGLSGAHDAGKSGAAHLTSFVGTDSILAIDYVEKFYNGDCEKDLIGCSVPATEHSVMCMGSEKNELQTFKRLITEIYPKGIVSIVSDSWDFWKVIYEYLPALKEDILNRDGRVVIRPDSGDPVEIICGTDDWKSSGGEWKIPRKEGAYEALYNIFGGTINEKGYKVLNPKIGLIYGDSITLERQEQILTKLEKLGFAATNLVLGVGSYTYQHCTRDTHGFAVKSTWGQVKGECKNIFKDPKTDSGLKKSAKGLLCVRALIGGGYAILEEVSKEKEKEGCLLEVFRDGKLLKETSFQEIRARLNEE